MTENVLLFEELLDKSFKIHHKNIQSLAIELFMTKITFQLQ